LNVLLSFASYVLIERNLKTLRQLYVGHIETMVITKVKSGSALSRVYAGKGIWPMEIIKTAIEPHVVLTTEIVQHCLSVVLYVLRSSDVNGQF